MSQPRILFLTRYGAMSAASRYRVLQYVPHLEAAGFECVVEALFPDAYIRSLYGGSASLRAKLRLLPLVAASLGRRSKVIRAAGREGRFAAVHVAYEALPFLPLAAESSLYAAGRPTVVDFDDHMALRYQEHPNGVVRALLGGKIPALVARSQCVTTANQTLANWAVRFNPDVTLIPNALDLERYPLEYSKGAAISKTPVICWIGTPATASYLRLLAEPLRELSRHREFVLKVIGAPDVRFPGVHMRHVPWSETTEVAELRSSQVGVMPLSDDLWSRGKSALKLLQYMAAGVAAVASPVGTNLEVLSDGENGLLARDGAEWVAKLTLLLDDPAYRERVAEAGRRTVEERFSLDRIAPRFVDLMLRITQDGLS